MEVCSSTEMGAPGGLAFGNGRSRTQNRPKQTTISPGKRVQHRRFTLTGCRHSDDLGLIAFPDPAQENNARFSSKWTLSRCTKGKFRDTTLFLYFFSYVG